MADSSPRPPGPRRSRSWIAVLVVLLVLVGLVVAADRVAQSVVQGRVATQLQSQLNLSQPPAVDLGPFPFLHEIVTRRVHTAQVRMAEVALPDDKGATASDVRATLYDVRLDDQFQPKTAGRGEATGLLPWASLSALTGFDISAAGPEQVRTSFEVQLGQTTVSGTITGRPVLDVENQAMRIEDADISLDSSNQAELEAVGQLVVRSIPLNVLPDQFRLTALTVRENGVELSVTGQDLPLRR